LTEEWISRDEMAEIRELSAKLLKTIVMFMENPFQYADKLQEANGFLASLMEIVNDLGLDGDNMDIDIAYTQPLTFADIIMQTAADKFRDLMRGE